MRWSRNLAGILLLGTGVAFAQTSTASRGKTEGTSQSDEQTTRKNEQSRRMLGVIPRFGITGQDAAPLTSGQKFHLFAKTAFNPFEFLFVGAQAGLSQAQDEFPEYGQGAAGYGKRYGAAFADEVSSGFWSNYFYPSLLKEDPRYFRLGRGGMMRRVRYALTQEFICHTDKGGRSFSWKNMLGAFTGGALSNLYYPAAERGAELTASRSAIAIGYGSLNGMVDEFYPDIARKLFHKREKKAPSAQ